LAGLSKIEQDFSVFSGMIFEQDLAGLSKIKQDRASLAGLYFE
jgi:hypothetical protein